MRAAAYAALLCGLLGGLWLATAVLSTAGRPPATVAEALGLDVADENADHRRSNAVAALTAECMSRLGFIWRSIPELLPEVPDPDLAPVAWADRWGFGVSTIDRSPPPGVPDPNMAALETMSAEVRSTYRAALYGSSGRPGCQQTASETVLGLRDRLLAPIREELDALDAAIAADPGVAKALATWPGCVAGVSSGLTLDRRTLPGALVQRFVAETTPLAFGSRAMNEVQAEERRVAGVLARCERSYASARAEVAARHEARFVASHRQVLAGIGAATRAAEAALPTLPP